MFKPLPLLLSFLFLLAAGATCFAADLPVTPPPHWSVPKISQAPKIDGVITESEWKNATCFTGYQKFPENGRGYSPIQTLTFLAWDDNYLYVAFRAPHTYRDPVLINVRGRDAYAFTDEAYETLLWPPGCDKAYAFIIGLASFFDDRFGDITWDSPGVIYEVSQHDNLFDAEMAIPWKDMETTPAPGMEMKAVFTHDINIGSRLMTNWHYAASTYHDKSLAGNLVLTDDAPTVRMLEWGPILSGFAKPELELANTSKNTAKLQYKVFMGTEVDQPSNDYLATGDAELAPGETTKIAPNWPVLGTALRAGRLTVSSGDKTLVDYAFPFQFSPEIKTAIKNYPSQYKLIVDVDAGSVIAKGEIESVRMTLNQAEKKILSKVQPVDKSNKAAFEIDTTNIAIGDYTLYVEALNSAKTTLSDINVAWSRLDNNPEWIANPVANERRVPKLFSPVSVSREPNGAVHTQMWGRSYSFDGSLFPTQIKSQSRKMLSEPIRLVGKLDGKALELSGAKVEVTEKSPDRAVLNASAKGNGVSVTTQTRVEFDGMYYTTFVLTPDKPGMTVESLKLEFPFLRDASTLMHHNMLNISSKSWSGATPEKWSGVFRPVVWFGDEYIGLCLFCETLVGWSNNFDSHHLQVDSTSDSHIFAMNIVDKPLKLDGPMKISFGFTATPAKPMPKNWLGGTGGWMEAWWDESNQFLHEAIPWEKWHELVDSIHEKGGKLFKYTQTNFLSFYGDTPPDRVAFKEADGAKYMDTPEKKYWGLEWVTQPQAGMAGQYAFCKNSHWRDLIVAGLHERLDKGRVDGIYFDCSQPRLCANALHGCIGGYDILAEREVRRRLYNIFDELDKDCLIFEHISDNMLGPVMNYSTTHYDGEQFSYGIEDYREVMTLERMRAFSIGTNWGHIPKFMSFAKDNKARDGLMALWMLHMPWSHITTLWNVLGEQAKAIENSFGLSEDADRLGYWENEHMVKGQTDDVKCTLYYKPGAIYIVVSNLADTPADVSLQLNTGRIRIDQSRLVLADYLKSQDTAPEYSDNTFRCKIKPASCVTGLLRIK